MPEPLVQIRDRQQVPSRTRIGIVLPSDRPGVRELARHAEELGFDSVWVHDRFADGHLEALTTMAAIAATTERIVVGAYMLNASLRDPAMLVKTVASLEKLAPGRIRILFGTGWDRGDYEALGSPFPSPDERSHRTRDALTILKRDTRIPVDVAGVRDDVLELAVAQADGWAVSADALDTYFERVSVLRRMCEEAGRPFEELHVSCTVPCIDDFTDRIADLAAHDMEEFRVVVNSEDSGARLERLIKTVREQDTDMSGRTVQANGIEIWTQSFGDPADPTILLVNGPGSGLYWPDELCEALSEGGRHVIRYDHRDTGRSTTVDFAMNPYTLSDVAADAVGVLDAYSVQTAHVVGISGGGMVAQTVALEHPDRVASLTSWGSTPLAASFVTATDGGLPGPDPEVVETIIAAGQATTDEERIDGWVATLRAYAGPLEPFDDKGARDLAARVIAHTKDHTAFTNHWMAWAASPDRTEMLTRVTAPTLVIHGAADRIVPVEHGEATAKAIPGAHILTIDDMGHDIPRAAMPQIIGAILEHTGGE